MRWRRSGGSQDARDAANAGHRGIIHCPTGLCGGDVRLVGTIVSGFLACVLLVLGGVLSGRLAHRAEGVIDHHTVRVFVYDCRAIKKPRQITSAINFMVGVTGIEPMTPSV